MVYTCGSLSGTFAMGCVLAQASMTRSAAADIMKIRPRGEATWMLFGDLVSLPSNGPYRACCGF